MRQTTHEKNLKSRHISHAHVVSMVASNTPEGALSTRQLLPELLSGFAARSHQAGTLTSIHALCSSRAPSGTHDRGTCDPCVKQRCCFQVTFKVTAAAGMIPKVSSLFWMNSDNRNGRFSCLKLRSFALSSGFSCRSASRLMLDRTVPSRWRRTSTSPDSLFVCWLTGVSAERRRRTAH